MRLFLGGYCGPLEIPQGTFLHLYTWLIPTKKASRVSSHWATIGKLEYLLINDLPVSIPWRFRHANLSKVIKLATWDCSIDPFETEWLESQHRKTKACVRKCKKLDTHISRPW
jgi:hypothetical protein